MKFLIINGPNLNMLGLREKSVYGSETLASVNDYIASFASTLGVHCDFFQSNSEGEIITKIHTVFAGYDACVINAGAYTHYSYAIRDAIACVNTKAPFAEVHMSDIHSREVFRHVSVIKEVCVAQISGFGKDSYTKAISLLHEKLVQNT